MLQITRGTSLLLVAGAIIAGGGVLGALGFDQTPGTLPEAQDQKYRSSIQVPDSLNRRDSDSDSDSDADTDSERTAGTEENENGENKAEEAAESAQLAALALISADQARAAALARFPGTAEGAELENEDGNLVYSVEVRKDGSEVDVKVDAGNGKILHVETDND